MKKTAALLFSVAAATAAAQTAPPRTPLPPVKPEAAGFSSEGLARIDRFFEREMAANRVPGAVVAIARDGRLVHYKAYGKLDPVAGTPMTVDAVFQLASMTKVMAAVGALTLNEDGRLPLKSRLDEYLPAFKDQKVGVVAAGGEIALEAPKQPIFIHDLYRHTSGITYGGRGSTAVHKLYPGGSAVAAAQLSGEEFVSKVSSLPLLHQPGTVWDYGFSTDVLGLVVEKVSGKRLGEFLKESVWDKLGMKDTTFDPTGKESRIARPFANDPLTGKPQRITNLGQPVKFDCGGACAYASVGDYLRFAQMLMNGGELEGKRVLSPKTVAWMTSDHLGPNIKNNVAGTEPHRDGYGFGLMVAVRLHDGVAATSGTKGDFSWNGANGTSYWADPKEKLVVVVGTAAPGEIRKYYREQMGALVYGAMTRLR